MNIEKYLEWYKEKSKETNGLILQATAAKMLNTTRQNIKRMVKTGKLKTYSCGNFPTYIGINEIEKIIEERKKNAKKTMVPFGENKTLKMIKFIPTHGMPFKELDEWLEEWYIMYNHEPDIEDFLIKKYKAWKKKKHTPEKERIKEYDELGEEIESNTVILEDKDGTIYYTQLQGTHATVPLLKDRA